MNKIILIGRLTHDPEMRETPNGIAVATSSIAVNREYNREETDFVPVEFWRSAAEFICRYAVKGDKIAVIGSLRMDKYEKDGEKRTAYKVVVERVELLSPKKDTEEEENPKAKEKPTLQETIDDLPF